MKRQIGKKNKLSMPDVYVLLFFMVIVALLATYIVPAGEFERSGDGRTAEMGRMS